MSNSAEARRLRRPPRSSRRTPCRSLRGASVSWGSLPAALRLQAIVSPAKRTSLLDKAHEASVGRARPMAPSHAERTEAANGGPKSEHCVSGSSPDGSPRRPFDMTPGASVDNHPHALKDNRSRLISRSPTTRALPSALLSGLRRRPVRSARPSVLFRPFRAIGAAGETRPGVCGSQALRENP